jgi:hypothetical protein
MLPLSPLLLCAGRIEQQKLMLIITGSNLVYIRFRDLAAVTPDTWTGDVPGLARFLPT